MKHLKRFNEKYSGDVVDLYIDGQVIKNGISSDIYENFEYIKSKDNYTQPMTRYGSISKDEALSGLLGDYLLNHTFRILENLSEEGKEITKNMHYFDNNNKYTITFSIISEKYYDEYLVDLKLIDIKKK